MPAVSSPGSSPDEAQLAALVAQLRTERDGLRRAMRTRAVIEQAKGVLMAQQGIDAEAAFEQLAAMSQHANIRLAELAAALVGRVAPVPGEPPVTDASAPAAPGRPTTRPAEPVPPPAGPVAAAHRDAPVSPAALPLPRPAAYDALQAQHQLLAARVQAASGYDDLVEAVAAARGWPPPSAVVLLLSEPDGALRLVATAGLPAETRSQWTRIPPHVELPLTVAVREMMPVLLDGPRESARFPLLSQIQPSAGGSASLPLVVDGRAVGVVGLAWPVPVEMTDLVRRYLTALADLCARAVSRIGRPGRESGPPTDDHGWLEPFLDALLTPAAVLTPVVVDGEIVDFAFARVNTLAREYGHERRVELPGGRLREMNPHTSVWLLPALREVLATGVARQFDDVYLGPHPAPHRTGLRITARVARVWDRLVYCWRVSTDAEALHEQVLGAERIARTGSFWWDRRTGEQRWSPQLLELFGLARPPAGPVSAAALVHRADRPAVLRAVGGVLAGREAATISFRLAAEQRRWLRLTAEPVPDGDGGVPAVRGTAQDVSDQRAEQARRHRVEEALASYRQRRESEQAVADAFQQALLPTSGELAASDLLEVRATCHALGRTGRVAASWYDLIPVDAERCMLVVGEILGEGRESTVAAARLCNAIRAYVSLGLSPATILDALNTLLTALLPQQGRATIALASYDRGQGSVCCATAGHSQPLLFRGPDRGTCCGPLGPPLGEDTGHRYVEQTVPVRRGDLLLLHTDGLVVRRSGDSRLGLDLLLDAAPLVDLADPDAVVGYLSGKLGESPDDDLCVIVGRIR
jgi:PAS domain-containing protein